MPRINRIRIINFSYNNDSRHIQDETFDFHGGENALLSLANGGGKSVLVQLFFQPLAPEIKIQGRQINAFFRKKRLPAYILVEWKLDAAGGYLLTGIGMVSAEVSGVEDEKNRVKYFTFTSKYTGASPFDLANIELLKQKGNILEIKPFKEAREMMAEREKKDPYNSGCFYDDDGERYRKRLAEFGIAQDEWKNILAKINDHEGGLDELFQKYKTSSQLLNEWIIKTIEKVIFRDRSEAHRLEEMLEGLVQEVIENEHFILEKTILDGFLLVYGEQVEALVELLNGLEEQKSLAAKLAALERYLDSEITACQEVYEENKLTLAALKAEQQRINLEERSYAYWLRNDEHSLAVLKLAGVETRSRDNEEKLEADKFTAKLLQAAGLRDELRVKKAELSGVEERLTASRSHYDRDERMRNLEYSLRQLTQEIYQRLELVLSRLNAEKVDQAKSLHQLQHDSQQLEQTLRNHEGERGSLQQQKKQFEAGEREVRAKLKLNLNRNLLGELAPDEIEKAGLKLQKAWDDLQSEGWKLAEEKTGLEQKRQEAEQEIQAAQEARLSAQNLLLNLEKEMAAYGQQEGEILEILRKYGLASELCFDQERLQTSFSQLRQNLERSLEEAVRLRDDSAESLFSLKNGRLHIPAELLAVLANKDIPYETGEAYLRNQLPEIRAKLLEVNPVLPYALILAKENIELLAQSLENLTLRRAIPVIAYEDLSVHLNTLAERWVQTGEGISLVCLYEGRVFDNDGLVKLKEELKQKQAEALEQYKHYAEEQREVVAQQTICGRFAYQADYRYLLEKQKIACDTELQRLQAQLERLRQEMDRLRANGQELERKIQANMESRQKSQAAVEMFETWQGQEKDYQLCRRRLNEVGEVIAEAEGRKSELAASQVRLQAEIGKLNLEIEQKKRESQEIQKKSLIYQKVAEAEPVEGTLEELEERLQALKSEYSGEIKLLEKRRTELAEECAKKEKGLAKLGISESDYSEVVYDEGTFDEINLRISSLEKLSKKLQKETVEAAAIEGAAKEACRIAAEEVRKLGAEAPLRQEDIKGDFQERFRELASRQNNLERENDQLSRKVSDYSKLSDQISVYLKGQNSEPENNFRPEQDIKLQVDRLGESYRQTEHKNRSQAEALRNNYIAMKANYRERNPNIANIYKGLDQLWEKAGMSFDDYYYLYERMSLHKDKLQELIKLHENQLSNLERNKKDMVQQSLLQAMRFYEEIEWISDRSKVHLQGRNRPVQMLKIELALDSSEAAVIRMKDYIEECIARVREETRQEKREDEVKKAIAKLMYSRELLNVYLGNSHIPVKVFKIDLNMQNSSLKTWEDAMRENSGGEKFVVYFSVLSALMAYTRSRTLEAAGAEDDKNSSVLVMDNPFGPISSEHLLNPLFEIAKKHRTQLICLSDLKQNSILNCFNLIYLLRVRSSAIGSNEYLKFEEIIRDDSTLQNDEKLEKAIFRASENRQLSLFE